MKLIFKGKNRVTSGFQLPGRTDHNGLDIVGDDDHNVRSVSDGKVFRIYYWDGVTKTGTASYGNLIMIRDTGGRVLYYAHLKSIAVKTGQSVSVGQTIGVMGNTGNSFGAHTHFEVRDSSLKKILNPADYLGIPNAKGTYTEGKSGWVQASAAWYWYEDGEPVRNTWRKENGWWYWLSKDGKMLTGIQTINGKRYYLNPETKYGIPKGACIITDKDGTILVP